ncbi:glycosyltransferase family 4 protein [Aestuariivivens sediminicola]|uniref:glycosyltransferase family 4 protein n=1 Tax=Aestuariivivens sediminicola TaxID=2913560 RepID=UPI001F593C9D|nr:glycosyltransferase [Aestuariivivens sediminicola]
MKNEKALFILHYSPPIHGASKVGDYILNSKLIKGKFKTIFIKIKSSSRIDEIGAFKIKKLGLFFELFFKVVFQLIFFRPKNIYFTPSPQGFAFYRDLMVVLPVKVYCRFANIKIFYHYHARGIREFTGKSRFNRLLTNYFVNNTHLILISEKLKPEVEFLNSYSSISILPNGVINTINNTEFRSIIKSRIHSKEVQILYLSNMMKDKGYDVVLEMAKRFRQCSKNVKINFAGAWSSKEDEVYFNTYVRTHKLEDYVTYHGLVQGDKKKRLFSDATIFIFPSSYKKEVFPLAVLEALSFGLPVLAFDIGAVSKIIHPKIGVITNKESIFADLNTMLSEYQSEDIFFNCRKEFERNYSVEVFEENLLKIIQMCNG